MPTLPEDLETSSSWIAQALSSSGYTADFSPASLWEVDRFFDDNTSAGQPKPGGLLAGSTGSRLFALGAYVGEVVRRSLGGTWHADDSDPKGEANIQLHLPDGSVVWPVQRAIKRLASPEDGIAAYGAVLGVPVGARPERPQRRGWFRRG